MPDTYSRTCSAEAGDLSNVVSQASDVNLKEMRTLERKWDAILKEGKKRLDVDIEVLYSGDGLRPIGFRVTEYIDDFKKKPREFFN